jgi:pimeloyl-ACP methyl ester carboxylesterase
MIIGSPHEEWMKRALALFCALSAPLAARRPMELTLRARDGVAIAARLQPGPGKAGGTLIIVAPGFSQNKDTPIMRKACDILASYGDVLCLDFRGTGRSEGRYHFGAQEQLDLEAAFRWAKGRYRETELMGFSMGGYIALRAAAEYPGNVTRLYLVSAPSHIKDIAYTLGPLRQLLSMPFRPAVRKVRAWAGRDYFFRYGSLRLPMPYGQDLAAKLKDTPTSMLVGGRDQLVLSQLSRKIFDALPQPKYWTKLERGYHAEYIPAMLEKEFRDWFLESRKKLKSADE